MQNSEGTTERQVSELAEEGCPALRPCADTLPRAGPSAVPSGFFPFGILPGVETRGYFHKATSGTKFQRRERGRKSSNAVETW
jgi:hypothetical protein